jgi:hypothetical protein
MILGAAALYWMVSFQNVPAKPFIVEGPFTWAECQKLKPYYPTGKCIPERPL